MTMVNKKGISQSVNNNMTSGTSKQARKAGIFRGTSEKKQEQDEEEDEVLMGTVKI